MCSERPVAKGSVAQPGGGTAAVLQQASTLPGARSKHPRADCYERPLCRHAGRTCRVRGGQHLQQASLG
jgi:hypothetical protein